MKEGRRPRRPWAKMVAGPIAAGGDAGPPYVAFCEWASRGAAVMRILAKPSSHRQNMIGVQRFLPGRHANLGGAKFG